jgi:uncharacterized membrane protein YoaK (UPF0700 family)
MMLVPVSRRSAFRESRNDGRQLGRENLEGKMFGWIIRGLWFVAGIVTGWFIANDAMNFGVIQMMVALLLIVLIIAASAFWPERWKMKPERSGKQP